MANGEHCVVNRLLIEKFEQSVNRILLGTYLEMAHQLVVGHLYTLSLSHCFLIGAFHIFKQQLCEHGRERERWREMSCV